MGVMFKLVTFTVLLMAVNATSSRPNIIFILADDLGWNDVGFHGSRQIPTPNIDSLAYDGIILNNYYVQPICTPTRGALLTGRHPIHIGLQHSVIVSSAPYGLGLNETILPQYLRKLGYANHIIGKWHLGMFAKEYTPTFRGFDSHFGYYQGMEDYWDHTYAPHGAGDKKSWGLDFRRNMSVVKTAFGQYSTELFTQEAERVIAEHDTNKPLFLYLPHQAVHSGNPITPLEAPWKYLKKFSHIKHDGRRHFAGMMSALDDSIGNVTTALAARGMLNNSIIVFSTDNGGPASGFDMNYANNWPLRGVKATLWEGGMRGAGFIWSPLLQKSNYVNHNLMSVFDWLPTLLRAAGYDMSQLPSILDGIDMWDSLSHQGAPPRKSLLHNIDPVGRWNSSAIRVGDMKLIQGEGGYSQWSGWYPLPSVDAVSKSSDCLRKVLQAIGRDAPRWKPVVVRCDEPPKNSSCVRRRGVVCLFNISSDPCEFHDISHQHPEVVQDLQKRIDQFRATAVPPRNRPEDPAGWPYYHGGVWEPWVNLAPQPDVISPL